MKNDAIEKIIKQAKIAYKKKEVPIGAAIVCNNKIIAKKYNLVESKSDATNHAEILVIKKASKKLKNWRLNDCELYVTLEPCHMCMGAIIQSRIKKIIYLEKSNYISEWEREYMKKIYSKNNIELIQINNQQYLPILKTFFKERRKN